MYANEMLVISQVFIYQNALELPSTKYLPFHYAWWRRKMETFSALLALYKRPVTRSFDVFFDLRLNKCLSKQSWGWWF